MNLTQKLLAFTLVGAEWVLWLLIILSMLSVAVMIERGLYYFSLKTDFAGMAEDLGRLLLGGKFKEAKKRLVDERGVEAEVARAGLEEAERGPEAVASAMIGARARVRVRLERNLAFLGTLGANAPFIGLFGTVLGIIRAFKDLSGNQAGGIAVVMSGISEALVATAVGLLVAIPAVVGFNFYNRRVRNLSAQIETVSQAVLTALRAETGAAAKPESKAETKADVKADAKADSDAKLDKQSEAR